MRRLFIIGSGRAINRAASASRSRMRFNCVPMGSSSSGSSSSATSGSCSSIVSSGRDLKIHVFFVVFVHAHASSRVKLHIEIVFLIHARVVVIDRHL